METKIEILASNEFYFLVNNSGYFLKTKHLQDFEEVRLWGGILFSGKVKISQHLFFRVGSSILKKKICHLAISKPRSETFWADVNNLDLKSGNHINKCWIGQKDENYESL